MIIQSYQHNMCLLPQLYITVIQMYIQVSHNKTLTGLNITKQTEKLHNAGEAASLPSSCPYISSPMFSTLR